MSIFSRQTSDSFVLDLRAKLSGWYKQCLRLAAVLGVWQDREQELDFSQVKRDRTVCVSFLLKLCLKKPEKLF